MLEQVGIYIILAVSLNIATGYLGQLPRPRRLHVDGRSYGCSIFIIRMSEVLGVGARDFVTGTPMALLLVIGGLIVGGLCAALAGIIIGIPALRLKGDYLAIITLAFAEDHPRRDAQHRRRRRIRAHGRRGRPHGAIPGFSSFLLVFGCVAVVCFLIHTMMKSRHGPRDPGHP